MGNMDAHYQHLYVYTPASPLHTLEQIALIVWSSSKRPWALVIYRPKWGRAYTTECTQEPSTTIGSSKMGMDVYMEMEDNTVSGPTIPAQSIKLSAMS